MEEESGQTTTGQPAHFCAICQTVIQPAESEGSCPACGAIYHPECWQENGGCAVYGCKNVPATESRRSIEIPISYWGQEQKPCPVCGAKIQAAAVRCRHCGTSFSSARPMDEREFQQNAAEAVRLPAQRKGVTIFFICSVVTCTAPFAALVGTFWWLQNRKAIRKLPSLYGALSLVALWVGWGQIILMIIIGILYSMKIR
jgi:predicted RNA-binding Zn-ribbon protein involved in translation (DUF1610 family)